MTDLDRPCSDYQLVSPTHTSSHQHANPHQHRVTSGFVLLSVGLQLRLLKPSHCHHSPPSTASSVPRLLFSTSLFSSAFCFHLAWLASSTTAELTGDTGRELGSWFRPCPQSNSALLHTPPDCSFQSRAVIYSLSTLEPLPPSGTRFCNHCLLSAFLTIAHNWTLLI